MSGVAGNGWLLSQTLAVTTGGSLLPVHPLIALVDDQRSVEAAIGDWLRDFERFLIESEQVVALAAFKLR